MTRLRLSKEQLQRMGVDPALIAEVAREGVRLGGGEGTERNKWGNNPCRDERFGTGTWFQSEWEREVWYERVLQERAGEIRNLRLQVPFRLDVNGVRICKYVADFTYEERERGGKWTGVVEDAKGKPTAEYRMKRRLMLACHGIKIRETYREKES